MRYSRALIPTLKEAPADATSVSHVLLLRAGYARRVGAGIYSYLPLGLRVLKKIEQIVREEMDAAGALEVLLPALLPAEYFRETGRWDVYGDVLLRIKDRKGGDYHLGPTHEEIITDLARREVRSYRDLPKNLYQIQSKFRDEPRPRGGLLRGREFIMKDAYSFDADEERARQSYAAMRSAYTRIFDRMGLTYRAVSADAGAIGGKQSEEFQVLVQSGEDMLAACLQCSYAANLEVATSPPIPRAPQTQAPRAKVHTPGHGRIEDIANFLKLPKESFLKSLVYVADKRPILAVVRGDHEINPVKLARAVGAAEVELGSPSEVEKLTRAAVGFAGPVGFSGRIIVDRDAASVGDGATGANETDYHFVHVSYGRDFEGELADLRNVVDGDLCPSCGASLKLFRGIEAGHIFLLGTHYTEKMGASYLDEKGEQKRLVMGCYGIGVSRLMATVVEQHHDENGIRFPLALAPYQVHLAQLGNEPEVVAAVAELERWLEQRGLEVLVDDRDERPGVKFKDADLIGIPLRVTVGAKALKNGNVELKLRTDTDPKRVELVPLGEIVDRLAALVLSGLKAHAPEAA